MSAVCVLTPIVVGSWPVLAAAIAGACTSMGFAMSRQGEEGSYERLRAESVELDVPNSEVLAESLERGEPIEVEKDGVRVRFQQDEQGRISLCVTGTGHSKKELKQIGQQVRQGWQQRLAGQPLTYTWDMSGVRPLSEARSLRGLDNLPDGGISESSVVESQTPDRGVDDSQTIQVPIQLRGQRLGSLLLRRQADQEPWTVEDQEVVRQAIDQVALALENARLLEEIQGRSAREQTINRLTASISRSLDPEQLLQTALSELGNLPDVVEASIYVGLTDQSPPGPDPSQDGGNGKSDLGTADHAKDEDPAGRQGGEAA